MSSLLSAVVLAGLGGLVPQRGTLRPTSHHLDRRAAAPLAVLHQQPDNVDDSSASSNWAIGATRLALMRSQLAPPDEECRIGWIDDDAPARAGRVLLLRHGESEWNEADRFTGWYDARLTPTGESQARDAAAALEGMDIDTVFVSGLKRVIKTAWIVLEELDEFTLPIRQSWRLNERMYGALTGLNKAETLKVLGEETFEELRREPPPLEPGSCYDPAALPQSRGAPRNLVPLKESFEDTVERVRPLWEEEVAPQVAEGKTVLIISSKNLLRSLIFAITDIPLSECVHLDLPNGLPLSYDPRTRQLSTLGKDGGPFGVTGSDILPSPPATGRPAGARRDGGKNEPLKAPDGGFSG